jgi:hypothetical protein
MHGLRDTGSQFRKFCNPKSLFELGDTEIKTNFKTNYDLRISYKTISLSLSDGVFYIYT